MPIPNSFKILSQAAVSCGYILTQHDDSHLIAIPWTEAAGKSDDLIEKMFGSGDNYNWVEPTRRLHGRKDWHISLGEDVFIDVSVMPRIATEKQRQDKRQIMDSRDQDIYDDYILHDLSLLDLAQKYSLGVARVNGVIEQLRRRRQRQDAKKGLAHPEVDPYKRRMRTGNGRETGYILIYPPNQTPQGYRNTTPPIGTYRDIQKQANEYNLAYPPVTP